MGYYQDDLDFLYGDKAVSAVQTQVVFIAVAFILAIVATILAYIFIVPEKRRARLNAFGKFLHDTVNFKYLIIEKILQAIYIFATAFVILYGICQLFTSFLAGIIMIIVAPIAIRFSYELLMMAVILVKNVISINGKLKNQSDGESDSNIFAAPDMSEMRNSMGKNTDNTNYAPPAQPQNNSAFCTQCGSPLDEYGNCPNCSNH